MIACYTRRAHASLSPRCSRLWAGTRAPAGCQRGRNEARALGVDDPCRRLQVLLLVVVILSRVVLLRLLVLRVLVLPSQLLQPRRDNTPRHPVIHIRQSRRAGPRALGTQRRRRERPIGVPFLLVLRAVVLVAPLLGVLLLLFLLEGERCAAEGG